MIRTSAGATLALISVLVLPAVAVSGPQRDSAVGAGTVGSESGDPAGAQHVAFAAFGGPTVFTPFTGFGGDPVRGHFRAGGEFVDPPGGNNEVGEFQQEGPVTCLVVNGNRARLVYPNKQARPEANEAFDTLIFLEDNRRGGEGPPDRVGFAVVPDETPADDPPDEQDDECIAPLESPVTSPLAKGDIRIHDAP